MAEVVSVDKILLGDVISFNLYGSNIINNVSNGKVIGIVDGTSLRNPQQAAANHANIYSSIPENPYAVVPNDFTQYNYLVVKLVDNTIAEYGIPWITPTITRLQRKTATVLIHDFDPSQLTSLVNLLNAHGYLNLTTSVS